MNNIKPAWTVLGLNYGLHGEMQATNRLSRDMALLVK